MENEVIYFWQEFSLSKHLFKNPFAAADAEILKEKKIYINYSDRPFPLVRN